MMKYKLTLLFFLTLPIVTSCQQEKALGDNELPDLSKAKSIAPTDSIDLENLGILNPHTIRFNDDFLCFYVGNGEQEMHFLDLHDMTVIEKNIHGQGPNQVSQYEWIQSTDKNVIKLIDFNKWDIYSINLDSLRTNPDTEPVWLYQIPKKKGIAILQEAVEVGRYVYFTGVYTSGNGWIYCYDKQTQEFRSYGDFPAYEELYSAEYMTKSMIFSLMMKATNGKRVSLSLRGTLDFYDITDDGGLEMFREHHYFLPRIKIEPNGTYAYSTKGIIGFCYGYTSDENYLYLLYTDKTFKEFKENPDMDYEYLFVYDWNGSFVKYYSLEKPLYDLAIDGSTLYGLSREVEPIVYIYDLKDLHKK